MMPSFGSSLLTSKCLGWIKFYMDRFAHSRTWTKADFIGVCCLLSIAVEFLLHNLSSDVKRQSRLRGVD